MFYTVTAYVNTGFNGVDIPANPSVLEGCDKVVFQDINVVQNRGLVEIDVNSKFEYVKNIDYVKIGDVYYTLASYPTMLNDNVCRLTLAEDYITTMGGIENVNFKNVFVEYANVPDDSFGRWIKPETRWSPSQIIKVEQYDLSLPMDTEGLVSMNLVNSTIDLSKQYYSTTSNTYTDPNNSEVSVSVPAIYPSEVQTQFAFKRYGDDGLVKSVLTSSPSTYIYQMGRTEQLTTGEIEEFPNPEITGGIAKARSLGIDSCILAQYVVPGAYIDISLSKINGENLQYTRLVPVFQPMTLNDLKFKYVYTNYTPRNNKLFYSNDWNKYVLFNMASGSSASFMPENLYVTGKADVAPFFVITSDLRSTGSPICYPEYLFGNLNKYMQNAIYGLPWNNAEIMMYGAAGTELKALQYSFGVQDRDLSYRNKVIGNSRGNINDILSGLTSTIQNILGGRIALDSYTQQRQQQINDFGSQVTSLVPYGSGDYISLLPNMTGNFALGVGANLMLQAAKSFLNTTKQYGDYKQEQTFDEASYNLNRANNWNNYIWENTIVAPSINFPHSESMRDFFGNGFYCLRYHLGEQDAKEYDEFLDYFGYPVGEVSDSLEFFNNRQYFNYVSCSDITILEDGYTELERNGLRNQLTNCRLWKVLPKTWDKSMGNPIVS